MKADKRKIANQTFTDLKTSNGNFSFLIKEGSNQIQMKKKDTNSIAPKTHRKTFDIDSPEKLSKKTSISPSFKKHSNVNKRRALYMSPGTVFKGSMKVTSGSMNSPMNVKGGMEKFIQPIT
jgi:hypothetical protein